MEEQRRSGDGGTPAGGGDLRVDLWNEEAKGKVRQGSQGKAICGQTHREDELAAALLRNSSTATHFGHRRRTRGSGGRSGAHTLYKIRELD
jgi:hypothetical protein